MLETIESVRPIGGAEWEIVADTHMTLYPELNRDALSLRRKFNALHSSTVPTGDPDCPDYVRRAKRAKILIEQCSDSTNLHDEEADLGIHEEDAGDDDEEEESTQPRRLFNQQQSRPLVRTPAPRSGGRTSGGVSEVTEFLMANLVARMERDDAEWEERRQAMNQQQQMNMMMMMAMVSAVNPAAASSIQSIQNQMSQLQQPNNAGNGDDNNSYDSDS
jgi:hypothetical protein